MKVNFVFLIDQSEIYKFWSHDFFIKELLPQGFEPCVSYLTYDNIAEFTGPCDVFCYLCRVPENYPWGFIPTYEQLLDIVTKLKPKIVVQTGDEHFYEEVLQEHNNIGNHCKLFLRQHNHQNYTYTKNTLHIPLGYVNNFPLHAQEITLIKDRKYNWCYIGDMKNSIRKQMLDTFLNIDSEFIYTYGEYDTKPEYCHNIWLDRQSVVNTYLNTIFAPHPKGWTTIDGMRLYEASLCGAIPVVVGYPEEILIKFFYEEMPPWVFENTWEEAAITCSELLKNKEYLQIMQNKILKWWQNRINKIQNTVKTALIS